MAPLEPQERLLLARILDIKDVVSNGKFDGCMCHGLDPVPGLSVRGYRFLTALAQDDGELMWWESVEQRFITWSERWEG